MDAPEVASERKRWRHTVQRVIVATAALVVGYAFVPVQLDDDPATIAIGTTVTVVAMVVLVFVTRRLIVRRVKNSDAAIGGLAVTIVADIIIWAITDYAIAYHFPNEFDGLETRVDALYYVIATLLTVGFGDITAQGQLARSILIGQMIFNALVITVTATVLARQLARRWQSE